MIKIDDDQPVQAANATHGSADVAYDVTRLAATILEQEVSHKTSGAAQTLFCQISSHKA